MSLSEYDNFVISPSYFWNCVTFSSDCPFLSSTDPKLWYFGVGIAVLYGAFLLMILGDIGFYWSLDGLQYQIDHYINLVTKKVKRVNMDQRRLMTTQERTEKLLKKSQHCKRIVTTLRGALNCEDPNFINTLTNFDEYNNNNDEIEWHTN